MKPAGPTRRYESNLISTTTIALRQFVAKLYWSTAQMTSTCPWISSNNIHIVNLLQQRTEKSTDIFVVLIIEDWQYSLILYVPHIGAKHQYATQPTRVQAATAAASRQRVRTRTRTPVTTRTHFHNDYTQMSIHNAVELCDNLALQHRKWWSSKNFTKFNAPSFWNRLQ